MGSLTRLVWEPLEAHFGNARQLILSPDAALWLIPWGAIPLANGKYAIEEYQIRYCISGRDLVGQTVNKERPLVKPVLFANPDFNLGPKEADAATRAVLRRAPPAEQVASSRGLGSVSSLPQVKRLPGTATEAAAIKPAVARYAGAEPVVCEDLRALEGLFKALHGPRVLVMSTHGFFLPDQEVAHDDKRSEGLAEEGSTSRAVLTTEGKPTVTLMTAFFANLSEGQGKADALRNAQLAQIAARRKFHHSAAHPYYWAAFTLTGE